MTLMPCSLAKIEPEWNKAYAGGSAETQAALERTIRETCDKTAEKLAAQYDALVTFRCTAPPLSARPIWTA